MISDVSGHKDTASRGTVGQSRRRLDRLWDTSEDKAGVICLFVSHLSLDRVCLHVFENPGLDIRLQRNLLSV